MSIVAKRSPIAATAELLLNLGCSLPLKRTIAILQITSTRTMLQLKATKVAAAAAAAAAAENTTEISRTQRFSVVDLFRTPNIRRTTLIISYLWYACFSIFIKHTLLLAPYEARK